MYIILKKLRDPNRNTSSTKFYTKCAFTSNYPYRHMNKNLTPICPLKSMLLFSMILYSGWIKVVCNKNNSPAHQTNSELVSKSFVSCYETPFLSKYILTIFKHALLLAFIIIRHLRIYELTVIYCYCKNYHLSHKQRQCWQLSLVQQCKWK